MTRALKAWSEVSNDSRMDETAIHKQLDSDSSADKFVGYIDVGVDVDDKAGLPVVNKALVFMVVSLTESSKITVGYFLTARLHGAKHANLLNCVSKNCT